MERYIWETAQETALSLSQRLRSIRKRRGISQKRLSEVSGLSYGSIKRFESSGQISLLSLIKLANALECTQEIRQLFLNVEYQSIDEVKRERK
ncbi:MAG: helix-turn-helix domain-containing protein [Clostridia bacterium]|nr:helix-turn-helix domain-containing protein [Clostridia bacterium]